VGPNGLNLLERGEAITLLGTVGLLYLMFMAGLGIAKNAAVTTSVGGTIVMDLASLLMLAVSAASGAGRPRPTPGARDPVPAGPPLRPGRRSW
jgi:Kef-type K+ transport system membrane component KefB